MGADEPDARMVLRMRADVSAETGDSDTREADEALSPVDELARFGIDPEPAPPIEIAFRVDA